MKKICSLFLILCSIAGKIFSQEPDLVQESFSSENDIIITHSNDTIICFITDIANLGGKTTKIHYKDKEGKIQSFWGKEVKEFFLDGYNLVQIPLNSNKPDGYTRHYRRIYAGTIQIFIDAYYASIYKPKKDIREIYTSCSQCERSWDKAFTYNDNIPLQMIRLPDGKYYEYQNKSDYNDFIVPFLMKCEAVRFTSRCYVLASIPHADHVCFASYSI
jgi:hypothetical protein